jgi:hypothetical protein
MPPGRNLAVTVGQPSDLRRLGDAVRRAEPGDYGPTVLLVIESVRAYRRGGRRVRSRSTSAECGPPRVMHGRPCKPSQALHGIECRSSANEYFRNL